MDNRKPGTGPAEPASANSRISPVVLVGVLTLILLGIFAAAVSRSRSAVPSPLGPRLVADPATLDFGRVRVEQPVRAAFTLRNTGDQPLQILEVPRVEVVDGC